MVFGLYRAPFTKALLVGCFVGLLLTPKALQSLTLRDLSRVLGHKEVWRLFTSPSVFVYDGIAPNVMAAILLYSFRVFERQMGTAKFSMFVLLSYLWAVAGRAILCVSPLSSVVSGPFDLIAALFPLFITAIPAVTPNYITICGIKLSDKTLTYLMGIQLMFSGGFASIIPAVWGLLFGVLYVRNVFCVQRYVWPRYIRQLCNSVIGSWWEAESPHALEARLSRVRQAREAAIRAQEDAEVQRQLAMMQHAEGGPAGRRGEMRRRDATASPVARSVPVVSAAADPDAVARLMAMGFGREESERALLASNNDETAAANRLLES